MNGKQIVFLVLFFDFVALTVWSVYETGLIASFEWLFSTPAGWQTGTDLVLALAILAGFIWVDAKRLGLRPWL